MEETYAAEHASVSKLTKLWGADVVAAAVASFGVSPFITIVDRAVAENASGKRCMMEAVKSLTRSFLQNPLQFCRTKEFAWIFGLYAATYVTANGIETYYDWKEEDGNGVKIAGTTAVNMTCVIAKDRAFAQMFGVIKPQPFPMLSVGMFALRDSLTVASCFQAPAMIAEYMNKEHAKAPQDPWLKSHPLLPFKCFQLRSTCWVWISTTTERAIGKLVSSSSVVSIGSRP